MKIVLTGATGFVGKSLVKELLKNNHQLVILTRNSENAKKIFKSLPLSYFNWDSEKDLPPIEAFESCDAIINLLGENIAAKRWSNKQKNKIRNSRILGTKNLGERIKTLNQKPSVWVQASAIGVYPVLHEQEINESTQHGEGFLAQTCIDWENEAQKYSSFVERQNILRFGVVLGEGGGALSKLFPLFKMGAGGKVSNGEQYMSWIHIYDLVRLITYAVENNISEKVLNATSPFPVKNSEFTQALANSLHRPAIFPVPAFVLKLAMGELSSIVLDSQKVMPRETLKSGFEFKYLRIEVALDDITNNIQFPPLKKKCNQIKLESLLWIKKPKSEMFDFFKEAKNLEKITPDWLNFKITEQSSTSILEGTVFKYKLKLHGIPLFWTSKIINWRDGVEFSDYQISGPYKIWHHTHSFYECLDGTLMIDKVYFSLPFSPFSDLLAYLWVKRDVVKIFSYRNSIIQKIIN